MDIKEFSSEWQAADDGMPVVTSEIFDNTPKEFIPLEMNIYSPTRLDYFAARALQGLVTGRSEKDRRVCAKQAVDLAKELVGLLDQASD